MKQRDWLSQCFGLIIGFECGLGAIATSKTLAQSTPSNIVPDNTLGAESSVVITNDQTLPLPSEAIAGGAVRGINLFHSFLEFNVSAGQGAYFLSPDASIQNILARVTGSNSSSILGTLGTFGSSQPNLFLINPNGIIFGANASLDVGGSFVATTANAVQLGETGFFSATQPQSSSLLTVNPSALLYSAIVNQSQITNRSRATRLGTVINGSPNRQFSGLQVLDGKSLLLVGGDVRFEQGGTLQAPGGRVELGGLAGSGTVGLNVDGNILSLNFPDTIQRADVSFGTFARVNVASNGGGDIAINARNIDVSGFSSLRAGIASRSRTTDSQGGDITLNATEQIKVEQGSQILNDVNPLAIGNSGNIRIQTGSLLLSNDAELITSAYGEGNAGSVTIDARDRIVIDGGSVMSDASQILDNKGKAGDIRITTGSLLVKNEAKLSTSTNGQGDTGSIIIDARDSVLFDRSNALSEIGQGGIGKGGDIRINTSFLSVTNGARLSTSTSGQGDAGSVIINASDRIVLDGGRFYFDDDFIDEDANIFSSVEENARGNGGDIRISTGSLSATNAYLNTSTSGEGKAGSVIIDARNDITLNRSNVFTRSNIFAKDKGGNIRINSDSLSATETFLDTSTGGEGDAGSLTIDVRDKISFNDSVITSDSSSRGKGGDINITSNFLSMKETTVANNTLGEGNAGNVIFNVRDGITFDTSGVNSSTLDKGKGGNIGIFSDSLSLRETFVQSTTSGKGDAGSVNINVRNGVTINSSRVYGYTDVESTGNGGNIQITAGSLSLTNRSGFIASTFGQGNAGNLLINARDLVSFDESSVVRNSVESRASGKGGDISIITGSLSVTNGSVLIANTFGKGNAGNVTINAQEYLFFNEGSGVFSSVSDGGMGKSGDIQITTGSLSFSNRSGVIASTYAIGNAGNITIDAKEQITLDRGSVVASSVETTGNGKGGDIRISTGLLSLTNNSQLRGSTSGKGDAGGVIIDAKELVSLDGQSNIFSNVFNTGTGNGGDIRISTNSLISNGSIITANTNKKGNAGNVIIEAREQVSLDNRSVVASSVGSTGIGKGGDIYFSTGKLSLINNSTLNSSTSGQGNAGNVIINAGEQVFLDGSSLIGSSVDNTGIGQGGDIRLTTNSLSLTHGAQLSARTSGQGNAGNIQINTFNDVSVSGTNSTGEFSSGLLTSTTNNSTGKGGDITVNTNVLRVSDGAVFNAKTSNNRNGGDITINTSLFEALNGGQLIATTSGGGSAGKISVNATNQVIVNGSDVTFNDRFAKFPETISNIGAASGFFVLSSSSGSAGNIEVTSPKVTLDNKGRFIASSASGDGGNITLQVSDLLLLRRNSQISTNAGTELKGGNGGNINVNSKYIVAVPEEDSDLTANAYTGAGGQVQINSQGIFGIEARSRPTNKSDITASSELGIAGVTNINSPDTSSLRNSLNQLSENIIDTNALIANSCIARRNNRQGGTFFITGNGGLPERPGDAPLSAYITGTMQSIPTSTTSHRPWKIGDPIVEPQGVYRLENGSLVMSRECR